MSKFDLRLSYKDCCILKHGLKNSLHQKQSLLYANETNVSENEDINESVKKQLEKEVKEEKRTLERFIEQIENEKVNNHMKAR